MDLWGHNIADALKRNKGDKSAAARALGIPLYRLNRRIEQYGLHALVRLPKAIEKPEPAKPMTRDEGLERLRGIIHEMVVAELEALFGSDQTTQEAERFAKRSTAAHKAWETRRARSAVKLKLARLG
jgi:hypothetical protein